MSNRVNMHCTQGQSKQASKTTPSQAGPANSARKSQLCNQAMKLPKEKIKIKIKHNRHMGSRRGNNANP